MKLLVLERWEIEEMLLWVLLSQVQILSVETQEMGSIGQWCTVTLLLRYPMHECNSIQLFAQLSFIR
jgi:hypothetical protein